MASFLTQPIGGYSYLGDTSSQGFESGFSAGTKTPNSNITWGDLLTSMQGSSQQSPAIVPTPLPQVTQQGGVPIYNMQSSLPQTQKKQDSTGDIINLLIKFFGL